MAIDRASDVVFEKRADEDSLWIYANTTIGEPIASLGKQRDRVVLLPYKGGSDVAPETADALIVLQAEQHDEIVAAAALIDELLVTRGAGSSLWLALPAMPLDVDGPFLRSHFDTVAVDWVDRRGSYWFIALSAAPTGGDLSMVLWTIARYVHGADLAKEAENSADSGVVETGRASTKGNSAESRTPRMEGASRKKSKKAPKKFRGRSGVRTSTQRTSGARSGARSRRGNPARLKTNSRLSVSDSSSPRTRPSALEGTVRRRGGLARTVRLAKGEYAVIAIILIAVSLLPLLPPDLNGLSFVIIFVSLSATAILLAVRGLRAAERLLRRLERGIDQLSSTSVKIVRRQRKASKDMARVGREVEAVTRAITRLQNELRSNRAQDAIILQTLHEATGSSLSDNHTAHRREL